MCAQNRGGKQKESVDEHQGHIWSLRCCSNSSSGSCQDTRGRKVGLFRQMLEINNRDLFELKSCCGGRRLELCDDTWKQRVVERTRLLQTVSGFRIFFFFFFKKGSLQTDPTCLRQTHMIQACEPQQTSAWALQRRWMDFSFLEGIPTSQTHF